MIYTIVIAFLLLNQTVAFGAFPTKEACESELTRWHSFYHKSGETTVSCEPQNL